MKKVNGIKILLLVGLFLISATPIIYFLGQNFLTQSEVAAPKEIEEPLLEPLRDEDDYLLMRIEDLENEIERKNATIDKLILENRPGVMDVMMWISTFLLNILSVFGIVRSFRKTNS